MGRKRKHGVGEAFEEESWEDMACREKKSAFFHGRQNHTLRKALVNRSHRDATVRREAPRDLITEASRPFPVTVVDALLDYTDLERHIGFSENDAELLDALEMSAVRISKEFVPYDQQSVVHYDVPVHGNMLIKRDELEDRGFIGSDPKRRARGSAQVKRHGASVNWPYFFGRFWDPLILYHIEMHYDGEINHKSFRPLCPLKGSPEYKERVQLGPLKEDERIVRLVAKDFVDASYLSMRTHTDKARKRKYFEIDLGTECEITHVGTMGVVPPRAIRYFPTSRDEVHLHRRWRLHDYLRIIPSMSSVCWLTEYSIQYRHASTRKWHDLPGRFEGNTDLGNEVRHAISVYTRYIRIVPHSWHTASNFTCMVYGNHRSVSQERVCATSLDSAEGELVKTVVPATSEDHGARRFGDTVRYTFSQNNFLPYRYDGFMRTSDDYRYGQPSDWQIRQFMIRNMHEDLRLSQEDK